MINAHRIFVGKDNLRDLNTDDKNTNTDLKNIRHEDLSETQYVPVEGSVNSVISFPVPHS